MSTAQWGDFVKEASSGFELVPDGRYDFQIKSFKIKPTGKGKPNINLILSVISGPQSGKSLFKQFMFDREDPRVLGIRMRELKALGIDPDQFVGTLEEVLPQIGAALVGKVGTAPVGRRTWNNEVRQDVGIFEPYTGAVAAPAAPVVPASPSQATPVIPIPTSVATDGATTPDIPF